MGWGKSIIFTLIGVAAIIFGGNMVVKNGTEIAYSLGMSETLVGLTIIAIGTSLPEFVTSVTAAWKKESEIEIGRASCRERVWMGGEDVGREQKREERGRGERGGGE